MISSHFIDDPTAYLSARSVPPIKDHGRGIAVGVVSVPACRANEERLALSAPFVDCPAGRAGLRTISRINFRKGCAFVGEHRLNLMPADIEDGPIKASLLGDTFEFGLGGHVLGTQTLNDDMAVPTTYVSCCFVRPMFASARLPGFQNGNATSGFSVTLRTPFLAGELFAGAFIALLDRLDVVWQRVACAVAEHQGNGNATVNADSESVVGGFSVDLAAKADLPAKGRQNNGRFGDRSAKFPMPAKLDPAELGQTDTRPAFVDVLDLNFTPNMAERFMLTFSFPFGKAAPAREKTAERYVEIFERSLLGSLTDGANPIEFLAKSGKLSALSNVIKVVAGSGLVISPVINALLKRYIPNCATNRRDLKHLSRLLIGRVKTVAVTTKNHINLIAHSPSGCNPNKGHAFLRRLNPAVSCESF